MTTDERAAPSTAFGPAVVAAVAVGTVAVCLVLTRELGLLGLMAAGGAVAALIAAMVHPLAPFALYFGALFFADTALPGMPVSVNQLLALLFLVSWTVWALRGRTIAIDARLALALGAAALYFAASAVMGDDFARGAVHCRYVFIYFALAMVLGSLMSTERAVLALAWIITLVTFAAAMIGVAEAVQKGILSSFAGRWTDAVRIKGVAKNSIVYGWNLLYAFPFAFLLFSELRRRGPRLLALGLGLATLGVAVLTFNRQTFALIALLVVLTAALYTYENRKTLLAVVTVLGVAVAVVAAPMIIMRVSTLGKLERDPSYLERRDQFIVATEMFDRHPVFGIGLGSYPAVWRNYIPADYSTYNMQYDWQTLRFPDFGYLQLLAETGVVGTAIVVAIMVFLLQRAVRLRRLARARGDRFAANLAAMILVLTLFWVFSNAMQDTFMYVRVWMLFGLAMMATERNLFGKGASQETPLPAAGCKPVMRVAMIAHLGELSGAGTSLVEKACHLDRTRFSPVVVVPSDGELAGAARAAGLSVAMVPNVERSLAESGTAARIALMASRLGYVVRLSRFLARGRFDVVMVNSTVNVFPGLAAWLAGVPVAWSIHETIENPSAAVRGKMRLIEALSCAVVYDSDRGAALFPARRVAAHLVIRNFADCTRFRPADPSPRGLWTDSEGVVVVAANGLFPRKGADVFLAAAALVVTRAAPPVRFVLVGAEQSDHSDFVAALHRQAVAPPLAGRVEFAGLCRDVPALMSRVSVLVSASRNEAWPIILLEAMAAGVPVVATRVGDCAAMLGEGERGLLAAAADPAALADAIVAVAADPAAARRRAIAARQWVEAEYGGPSFWRPLEDLLARAAGARG